MTLYSTNNKKIYTCDGSQTEFDYDFVINESSHLHVYLHTIESGVETELTENTDYTVAGAGEASGGSITTIETYSSDYKIVLLRTVPVTQPTDYTANDPFPAAIHEGALDRLTMIAQQLSEKINRALLRNVSESTSLELPSLTPGWLYTDGSGLSFSQPTNIDYAGTVEFGLDASKAASPSRGDVYIATDTVRLYICFTNGSWTHTNIQVGDDADKAASPVEGDVYFASDVGKIYLCVGAGSWGETVLPSIDEDDMSSNSNVHVPTQQSVREYIQSLIKDEDDLSSDSENHVPTQQSVKAYVDTRAQIETGSYTGDGSTSQEISLTGSFTPKYVKVWERNGTDTADIDTYETTAEIMDDHANKMSVWDGGTTMRTLDNRIIAFGAGSFTVDDDGADNHPNTNSQVYNYMAIG